MPTLLAFTWCSNSFKNAWIARCMIWLIYCKKFTLCNARPDFVLYVLYIIVCLAIDTKFQYTNYFPSWLIRTNGWDIKNYMLCYFFYVVFHMKTQCSLTNNDEKRACQISAIQQLLQIKVQNQYVIFINVV